MSPASLVSVLQIAVFGNGVFPSSMKGLPPAPVTKIRDSLARQGRVVIVDEFRTSKVCHHCHHETQQNRNDWGSKHCKSVCHWTFNRDVNAARNIATIFRWKLQGYERPMALRAQLHH